MASCASTVAVSSFGPPQETADTQSTISSLLEPAISFLEPVARAPFPAIRRLFDHLRTDARDSASLNATYPSRGLFKTAAMTNPSSDQKLTLDLSPKRVLLISADLRASLAAHGLEEVLSFFSAIAAAHIPTILSALSNLAGIDLAPLHKSQNINFRLCDYWPGTAAPESDNGCGPHTDYGTFSIIFQDEHAGLEVKAPGSSGWIPIPPGGAVLLFGWCALILSGGRIHAVKHRVRRLSGTRRLSAVLFVAPDVDVALKPVNVDNSARQFSELIKSGAVDVKWFKEVMGKRWRWREGNESLANGELDEVTQDEDIEKLVFGLGSYETRVKA
ncbi:hypothetical protein H2201_009151 [Coniosporium apollinis]|uniref:Fe2OG dioxygenase domain-containing protein n=2 Tax=Coniosporium TaxID=2810619 RepID=A0ABQ9NGF4_9PEZI|nr:hypothetical protein H2199_009097 [Cladosporium sp. JES 115]KAJ9653323.1 hypothetical protein H2201_009151 [Coniosporium apollinis]